MPTVQRRPGAAAICGLAGLIIAFGATGCVTRPKEINGHKVVGTRWVDGHLVYVLAESDTDRERMRASAEEADTAAKGVVFKPSRPKR